jgi:type VI secretion system protein ImpF
MSALASRSPMPLFDRLAANGGAPLSIVETLQASVARELGRLFNTRSPLTFEAFMASEGTVLDYGAPDFTERSLRSAHDREAIAAVMTHAIALFEPRFVNATVDFAFPSSSAARAVLRVGGDVRVDAGMVRVTFELEKDAQGSAGSRAAEQG